MIAVTGKKLSQIARDIEDEYGAIHMEERDYKFSQEKKDQIYDTLLIQKQLPEMDLEIDKISYLDGCKVHPGNRTARAPSRAASAARPYGGAPPV